MRKSATTAYVYQAVAKKTVHVIQTQKSVMTVNVSQAVVIKTHNAILTPKSVSMDLARMDVELSGFSVKQILKSAAVENAN